MTETNKEEWNIYMVYVSVHYLPRITGVTEKEKLYVLHYFDLVVLYLNIRE